MKALDVIAVGNAILDISLSVQENNVHTQLNRPEHILSFAYGEKIHVDHCEFLIGGNACNVAVGLKRLGWNTSLCAEIGDDEFSQKIIKGLTKESIDISLLKQTVGAQSSFAVGINYGGERTLFVEHIKRKHDFHLTDVQTAWIYLTSLGEEWKKPYQQVVDYVKKNDTTNLAFSPGTHQFEEDGLKFIHDILPATYVLFANKEEAVRIVKSRVDAMGNSKEAGVDIRQLLLTLQRFGPRIVVVTDGAFGSYSVDEKGTTRFLEAFPAHVLQKTGAGDAYASGFLSAIISGFPANEAMRWGGVNASSVIENRGAQAGLLGKEEMIKKLAAHPKFQPKET